jgi:large conductance mechanosensitive channel
MIQGFRDFLFRQNFFALALAVVVGTATSKVVTSLVEGIIMPLVSLPLPAGNWRDFRLVIGHAVSDGKIVEQSLLVGRLLGAVVDFFLIALVAYWITRRVLKSPPPPDLRTCPYCKEAVPVSASRCKFCTAEIEPENPTVVKSS